MSSPDDISPEGIHHLGDNELRDLYLHCAALPSGSSRKSLLPEIVAVLGERGKSDAAEELIANAPADVHEDSDLAGCGTAAQLFHLYARSSDSLEMLLDRLPHHPDPGERRAIFQGYIERVMAPSSWDEETAFALGAAPALSTPDRLEAAWAYYLYLDRRLTTTPTGRKTLPLLRPGVIPRITSTLRNAILDAGADIQDPTDREEFLANAARRLDRSLPDLAWEILGSIPHPDHDLCLWIVRHMLELDADMMVKSLNLSSPAQIETLSYVPGELPRWLRRPPISPPFPVTNRPHIPSTIVVFPPNPDRDYTGFLLRSGFNPGQRNFIAGRLLAITLERDRVDLALLWLSAIWNPDARASALKKLPTPMLLPSG